MLRITAAGTGSPSSSLNLDDLSPRAGCGAPNNRAQAQSQRQSETAALTRAKDRAEHVPRPKRTCGSRKVELEVADMLQHEQVSGIRGAALTACTSSKFRALNAQERGALRPGERKSSPDWRPRLPIGGGEVEPLRPSRGRGTAAHRASSPSNCDRCLNEKSQVEPRQMRCRLFQSGGMPSPTAHRTALACGVPHPRSSK